MLKKRINILGLSARQIYFILKEKNRITMAERTFYLHLETDFKNLTDSVLLKDVKYLLNEYEKFKKELYL